MRISPTWALLALLGCDGKGELFTIGDATGELPSESDADTDADADSDADSDTDTDSDADSDPTGETGAPEPVEDPPDWLVDCNGQGDFESIQQAIDAAVSGQRIGVAPCEYHELVTFRGKRLDVFGTSGSAATVLDGDGEGPVVRIWDGEPDGTRLAGLTITGGDDNDGAAISVVYSSIELEDIVMTGNEGDEILHSEAGIVDGDRVVIVGNDIPWDGDALKSDGGGLTLTRSTVDCDEGNGALWHHNLLILTDSTVSCRSGEYGIRDYHGEDQIRRCIVRGGTSAIEAYDVEDTVEEPDTPDEHFVLWNSSVTGDSYGVNVRYMDADIVNSVLSGEQAAVTVTDLLWGSQVLGSALVGAACGVDGQGPLTLQSTASWDNGAHTCGPQVSPQITSDPLFVSWPNDVHLQPGSPLVDAGPQGADYEDTDGSRNDIGVYGGRLPLVTP
jgi:hypothetical protein